MFLDLIRHRRRGFRNWINSINTSRPFLRILSFLFDFLLSFILIIRRNSEIAMEYVFPMVKLRDRKCTTDSAVILTVKGSLKKLPGNDFSTYFEKRVEGWSRCISPGGK